MFTLKRFIGGTLFLFVLAGSTWAQESPAPVEKLREPVPAAPLVTATASAKRVRFVSPGSVVQLRLEVYNEAGQKLFDTELHGGNVLDWHLQDGAGEHLPSGSYACVLTIKSLSGRLSQRVGLVTVNDKKTAVSVAGGTELSTAQQQIIGPVEGNGAFTVLQESEAEAITAVTHDGTKGQVARTRGALSFRVGDFFSGKDIEQMRLTEEGNLGLGTDKPQAKLEVAGDVRASGTISATKGIEFADGTVQTTGLSGRKDASGNVIPNATGTGTQDRIAKWIDNSGALGNTAVSETNGSVVVGTVAQTGNLQIFGPATADVFAGMGPDVNVGPAFNYGYAGGSFGRSAGFFNVRPDASAVAPNPSLRFMTANVQRMIVTNTGDVGIGTLAPGAKLDVVGNVNTSTQYNIGGSRVLSIVGTDNVFAGVNAGFANTTGDSNAFFGKDAGFANTTGFSNAFFGFGAGTNNTEGIFNAFFGRNAGLANTTGTRNAFFGRNAGDTNNDGNFNTIIGASADVGSASLTNATAIGANAQVTQSNSLVLGSINTVNSATADTDVGMGTTAPKARLHVQGGNIYVGGPGQGIILKSPDGLACRLLTIDNTGNMITSTIACP